MLEGVTVSAGQVLEQAGSEDKLVIVKLVAPESVTCIGYVPGGVTVVPVAKVVEIVAVVPVQNPGIQFPPKQVLQSVKVESFVHVYGPVPLVTVMFPFVSWQAVSAKQGLTIMVVESLPQLKV